MTLCLAVCQDERICIDHEGRKHLTMAVVSVPSTHFQRAIEVLIEVARASDCQARFPGESSPRSQVGAFEFHQ